MKFTKFFLAAIVATFAVLTVHAQIIPGGYYRFERINFSLILQQQGLNDQNYGAGKQTINTMRMGNKEMLAYLAEAFHTSWPDGAYLAVLADIRDVPQNYNYIYVLDKNGNPIANGNWGYYSNENNYAYFRIDCSPVVKTGQYRDTFPIGYDNNTHFQLITFEINRTDDDWSLTTDLKFQGIDKGTYSEQSHYYTVTTSMNEDASINGGGPINATWTIVTGHVSIGGKWVDVF